MRRANGGACSRCGGSGLAAPSAAAAAPAAAAAAAAAASSGRRRLPLLPPCRVGVDPSSMQDLIVGGAVSAAVGAALVGGTRKDAEACTLCQGTGGARCFACEGTGKREPDGSSSSSSSGGSSPLGSGEEYDREGGGTPRPPPASLDEMVGGRRTRNPRACRVCAGTGMVLCSQCKGSGYK
jgi:hypothetical protein